MNPIPQIETILPTVKKIIRVVLIIACLVLILSSAAAISTGKLDPFFWAAAFYTYLALVYTAPAMILISIYGLLVKKQLKEYMKIEFVLFIAAVFCAIGFTVVSQMVK